MPGLVPGTHVFRATKQGVGGRDKPGHDALGDSMQTKPAQVIGLDTFLQSRTEQIVALARRHAVPIVTPYREFAVVGQFGELRRRHSESWQQAGERLSSKRARFAAAHVTAVGPSRQFAATRQFSRFRSEADIPYRNGFMSTRPSQRWVSDDEGKVIERGMTIPLHRSGRSMRATDLVTACSSLSA
jgi:hypothetical protein